MDQENTETNQPEQRQFEVRLHQVAEVHTETFNIEADNEADAIAKAQEVVLTKELGDVKYRLEAIDVTPEEADEEPEEQEDATANGQAAV